MMSNDLNWNGKLEVVSTKTGETIRLDKSDSSKRRLGGWHVHFKDMTVVADDSGDCLKTEWRVRNVASTSTQVQWDKAIEAVFSDGSAYPAEFKYLDDTYGRMTVWESGKLGCAGHFYENGLPCAGLNNWTIRNVATPAADEWGAEVALFGGKPEWLDNNQFIAINCGESDRGDGGWYGLDTKRTKYYGYDIMKNDISIRLPASHPYYAQIATHSPATPPLSLLTGVDRVERMEALVRRMAALNPVAEVAVMHTAEFDEARAIASTLPPLPDPDLVKAREIAWPIVGHEGGDEIKAGNWDDSEAVQAALAGIKAGREMGR